MANLSSNNFGLTQEQRLTPSIARIRAIQDKLLSTLRVAVPAIVQRFEPGPPATVDVLVATDELVMQNEGTDSPLSPDTVVALSTVATQIAPLLGLPVVMPGGGGASLTFPIKPGDECLVLFADTPLEVWLQNGGLNNAPTSPRRHSLSDGLALFGIRSTPRGLANYSTSSTQLRTDDGTVVIDLAGSQITVTAPTVTVNATTANVNGSSQVNISGAGNTNIEGRNFLTHVHSGVQVGLANSGPVV